MHAQKNTRMMYSGTDSAAWPRAETMQSLTATKWLLRMCLMIFIVCAYTKMPVGAACIHMGNLHL